MNEWLATIPIPRQHRAKVVATSELARIRELPRFDWKAQADLPDLVRNMTEYCKVPGGSMTLRPVQAAVLGLLHEYGGIFSTAGVGTGKTLMSLLAAHVVDARAAVLLVPASLVAKTRREMHALSKHWRIRPLRIISYEMLGRPDRRHMLDPIRPDLLICDEAHYLKNTKAAVTNRVRECLKQFSPRRMFLSGSMTSRTLRDYWHMLRWALLDRAPLPRSPQELQTWMFALDEKVPDGARLDPGPLLALSPPDPESEKDLDELQLARVRYSRRLCETAGVVSTGSDLPPNGLECSILRVEPSPAIAALAKHLRTTWETPCGLPFETAMDLWRHEREASCGLYYRWTKPAPKEWLAARKVWSAYVREILSKSRKYDSPLLVAQAVMRGDLDDAGALAQWQAVSPMFEPETEPVWVCDSTLRIAAEWLHKEKGICWVHHGAFGAALSAATGVPYFREGGADPSGTVIDQHRGPAIASIQSCHRGFNLQHHYRNLVVTCPTKNALAEQTIGRTHRSGQEQDTVFFTFLQRLEGDEKALAQARADAAYVEQTLNQPQRLGVATWIDSDADRVQLLVATLRVRYGLA